MNKSFEETYPFITRWADAYGWIEIGADEESSSFIKAFSEGDIVWEGDDYYETLDAALQALETGIARWLREIGDS